MQSSNYPFRLLGNYQSRSTSNILFYTGKFPLRKPLCEIQENIIEDSCSFLEEGIPKHVPKSYQKASIDVKHAPDLDKTIINDPANLTAIRSKEKNTLPISMSSKQPSTRPTMNKKALHLTSELFRSIIKGDLNHCILCLNKRYNDIKYRNAHDLVKARDSHGRTALHVAIAYNKPMIAELLLKIGANPNSADFNQGQTPLHYAFSLGNMQLVKLLTKNKASLMIKDHFGRTPEHCNITESKRIRAKSIKKKSTHLFEKVEEAPKSTVVNEATEISITKNSPLKMYKLIKQLGSGSFGEVYLSEHRITKSLYALKVISKSKIVGHNLLRYIMSEKNVMTTNNHPFIVKLYAAFQTNTNFCLVMDYCPGGDLSQSLQREKKFTENKARLYLAEIILAIEDLHKRGIIFRDLKPSNVVIDDEGHAKLTDFGLSKEGISENDYSKSFCGSIAYLAPEIISRSGHGRPVDWYLVGVMLYEMLVGQSPYFSQDRTELFANILKGALNIPSYINPIAKDLIISVTFP